MTFIAHKISRARWDPLRDIGDDAISADAVTADLRTKSNKLSFWICEGATEASLCDVALALASSGNNLDVFDIAWLDESTLKADRITLQPSPGKTPVEELKERHIDAINLDLDAIGRLARLFAAAILEQNQHKRFSRAQVKDFLVTAIRNARLSREKLYPKLSTELPIPGV